MNTSRLMPARWALCAAAAVSLGACGGTRPFSVATPGLATMAEEEQWVAGADYVPGALDGTSVPGLSDRVENLFDVYEEELERARRAQGGLLNGVLQVSSLLLPASGTATSLLVSDPDNAAAIAAGAAAATTAVSGVNAILKPQQKAAVARTCELFLRNALESLSTIWARDQLGALSDDDASWRLFFAVRSSLDAGRNASCPTS